jgi:hypothetical protein
VPGPLPDAAPEEAFEARVEATPEQAREAAQLSAGIDDPELRKYVAKAIKASLARTPDDRSV